MGEGRPAVEVGTAVINMGSLILLLTPLHRPGPPPWGPRDGPATGRVAIVQLWNRTALLPNPGSLPPSLPPFLRSESALLYLT